MMKTLLSAHAAGPDKRDAQIKIAEMDRIARRLKPKGIIAVHDSHEM
jgi:hypothetical protein